MKSDVLLPIFNSMAEGMLFLDAQDCVRFCNPAAERIRRIRAEQILGKSVFDLHPPRAHERIRELLRTLKSGTMASSSRVIEAGGRFFENSYSAIRSGGGDYLGTLLVSRDITEQKRLGEENLQLREQGGLAGKKPLLTFGPTMERLLETIRAVAPLDSTVLVTGESGTGKERIVEILHRMSRRREKPLVTVNCAALPESLVESELFGHVRGAFTGAVESHEGKFMQAHGGTLFLDEIGEVPLVSQAKLLRAIQEKVIQPVGGHSEACSDVRIIAATNRDLAEEVKAGRFREDLFYRLNVIRVHVPPLRERRDEVLPLAEMFLAHFSRRMAKSLRSLAPQTRKLLLSHPLPGNVRQLEHAMECAVALGRSDVVLPSELPPEMLDEAALEPGEIAPDLGLREALEQFERAYITKALASLGGRKQATAQLLGVSRKNLWEKIKRYAIEPEQS